MKGIDVTGVLNQGVMCALLLALWSAPVAAQSSALHWATDAKSGCRVWDPHPQPNQSISWSGQCVGGLAEGRGTVQWYKDALPLEKDEGVWHQGRQTGEGSQVWPTGSYRGNLHDGEPSGHGILTVGDARYEGEFINGKPDGGGTLRNSAGVFQGVWRNGCFRDDKRKIAMGTPVNSCP